MRKYLFPGVFVLVSCLLNSPLSLAAKNDATVDNMKNNDCYSPKDGVHRTLYDITGRHCGKFCDDGDRGICMEAEKTVDDPPTFTVYNDGTDSKTHTIKWKCVSGTGWEIVDDNDNFCNNFGKGGCDPNYDYPMESSCYWIKVFGT